MAFSAIGSDFIVINRCDPVAITMKNGRFKCLNRKQAYNALNVALLLGIPVDVERNFKGEYFTYVFPRGITELRKKHNWSPPQKRSYRHGPKREKRVKREKQVVVPFTINFNK